MWYIYYDRKKKEERKNICLCVVFMILKSLYDISWYSMCSMVSKEVRAPLEKSYIKYLGFEMWINKLLDKEMLNSLEILFPLNSKIFPFSLKKKKKKSQYRRILLFKNFITNCEFNIKWTFSMNSSLSHILQYKDDSENGFIHKKLTAAREVATWSM